MATILGRVLIIGALVGFFIVALIAFPGLRRAIKKLAVKVAKWWKKHLLLLVAIIVILLAIIFKDTTIAILLPLSQVAVIILGICILLGCINKKFSKNAWKIGSIAALLIFVAVVLQKLPW